MGNGGMRESLYAGKTPKKTKITKAHVGLLLFE